MMTIGKLATVLRFPAGYRLFGRIVGGDAARKIYVAEYVKPLPGNKILDV